MEGASIQIGTRVYIATCVAGEPGIVHEIDRKGCAKVEWVDLPELGRWTTHSLDTLVADTSFTSRQLDLFNEIAA
jgi:hypothetical protein